MVYPFIFVKFLLQGQVQNTVLKEAMLSLSGLGSLCLLRSICSSLRLLSPFIILLSVITVEYLDRFVDF